MGEEEGCCRLVVPASAAAVRGILDARRLLDTPAEPAGLPVPVPEGEVMGCTDEAAGRAPAVWRGEGPPDGRWGCRGATVGVDDDEDAAAPLLPEAERTGSGRPLPVERGCCPCPCPCAWPCCAPASPGAVGSATAVSTRLLGKRLYPPPRCIDAPAPVPAGERDPRRDAAAPDADEEAPVGLPAPAATAAAAARWSVPLAASAERTGPVGDAEGKFPAAAAAPPCRECTCAPERGEVVTAPCCRGEREGTGGVPETAASETARRDDCADGRVRGREPLRPGGLLGDPPAPAGEPEEP